MEMVTEQIRAKVTQDIIANISSILAAQGLKLVSVAASPHNNSPADVYKSSCASAGAPEDEPDLYIDMMQHRKGGQQEIDSINLLSEPTPCSLLQIFDGFPIEVARGQVYPQQKVLHTIAISEGYVVVSVDSVNSKYRGNELEVPPNDDTRTVGQALVQRVLWRKEHILINPAEKEISEPLDPMKGTNNSLETKLLCERQEIQPKKGAKATKNSSKGIQKKGRVSSYTAPGSVDKSSKKTRGTNTRDKVAVSSAWAQPHSKFIYGKKLMSASNLLKAVAFMHQPS